MNTERPSLCLIGAIAFDHDDRPGNRRLKYDAGDKRQIRFQAHDRFRVRYQSTAARLLPIVAAARAYPQGKSWRKPSAFMSKTNWS